MKKSELSIFQKIISSRARNLNDFIDRVRRNKAYVTEISIFIDLRRKYIGDQYGGSTYHIFTISLRAERSWGRMIYYEEATGDACWDCWGVNKTMLNSALETVLRVIAIQAKLQSKLAGLRIVTREPLGEEWDVDSIVEGWLEIFGGTRATASWGGYFKFPCGVF